MKKNMSERGETMTILIRVIEASRTGTRRVPA
jgi:hypothetical protein